MWPWSSRVTLSRYFEGMYDPSPSATTTTPNSFFSFSRWVITWTISLTTFSMIITWRLAVAPVLGSVTVSVVMKSAVRSSTEMTRLASPAMAAP